MRNMCIWVGLMPLLLSGCGGETGKNGLIADEPQASSEATSSEQPAAGTPTQSVVGASSVLGCSLERIPIAEPDGALLNLIERVLGSYPIAGAWASPTRLAFTPSGVPFEGELVVSQREGELVDLSGCAYGIEVPVSVAITTGDGALDENVDGTILLTSVDDVTVDGSPAPFRAELSAVVDMRALSGSFTFADDPEWTLGNSALKVELTPFGTRGSLGASIQPKQTVASGPGEVMAAPPPEGSSLLTWHGGDVCAGHPGENGTFALYPAPSAARQALDAARDEAAAGTYLARYADGTETQIAIEIGPLTVLCATSFWASYWHFPTRAHLRTDDGRIDVSVGVALDPSYALLHYNSLTNVPWAYPPALASEAIGLMDVTMTDYAQVGIESWFDLTPQPAGWVKVLGYRDGACIGCDDDGGCAECSWAERVELLSLFIGTQADRL